MDEPEVRDLRKVKQDELGPAAVIRTTTLKPKDGEEPKKKSSGPKTEAQLAVAAAKARDEGRPESAIAEPTKKAKPKPPSWSESNKAIADRKIDAKDGEGRINAAHVQTKNPLEEADLFDGGDLSWCGCGRALYILPDKTTVLCRDGHKAGVTEGKGPLNWEDAARALRAEHTSVQAGMLMSSQASDIALFWEEEDAKEVSRIIDKPAPEPAPGLETQPEELPEETAVAVAPADATVAEVAAVETDKTLQTAINIVTKPLTDEELQMMKEHVAKIPPRGVGGRQEEPRSLPPHPLPNEHRIADLERQVSAMHRTLAPLASLLAEQQSVMNRLAYEAHAPFETLMAGFVVYEELGRVAELAKLGDWQRTTNALVGALEDAKVWATTWTVPRR